MIQEKEGEGLPRCSPVLSARPIGLFGNVPVMVTRPFPITLCALKAFTTRISKFRAFTVARSTRVELPSSINAQSTAFLFHPLMPLLSRLPDRPRVDRVYHQSGESEGKRGSR